MPLKQKCGTPQYVAHEVITDKPSYGRHMIQFVIAYFSLDNGTYEIYENILRQRLKQESMSGQYLHELDKNDFCM